MEHFPQEVETVEQLLFYEMRYFLAKEYKTWCFEDNIAVNNEVTSF